MSDHEKMPEPVKVWLYMIPPGDWYTQTNKVEINPKYAFAEEICRTISGPHKIVPGMMRLDELAAKCFHIWQIDDNETWRVSGAAPSSPVYKATYPTALEAQWAATCLARTQQEK
ncbi:MAG: hypothetical protein ACE1Y4_03385 [Lysobacterales bacterium]